MWHLFQEKETLLYKVFSIKYFPSGDIFRAVLNPRCSFAWKSIKQVREMISNGARWRIEDGKDIWIWQHRWIPSSGSGKVVSSVGLFLGSSSGFVYPKHKKLGSKFINRHFLQWEADCIKSIPLSAHIHSDLLI